MHQSMNRKTKIVGARIEPEETGVREKMAELELFLSQVPPSDLREAFFRELEVIKGYKSESEALKRLGSFGKTVMSYW